MTIDPNNLGGTARLTFSDDFNNLSLWNGSSGTWATTFWYQDAKSSGASLTSNGEQQWYLNANYAPTAGVRPWSVENGAAVLTATPTPASIKGKVNGYAYVSGELNTHASFAQTYGYFEMRAELPKGKGFWPAFWLMPTNGAWPPELDIMEVLGSSPSTLTNTVHTAANGYHAKVGKATQVADTSAGYHTYGVDWQADTITWYFDGKAVYETATPADMHSPMYIIANLAVGGYWPGSADGHSSAEMKIDYIRAYAESAGHVAAPAQPAAPAKPAAPAAPAPAAADDHPLPVQSVTPAQPQAPAATDGHIAYANGNYQAGAGIDAIVLTGWRQTVHAGDDGTVVVSTNNANHLYGGAGDDTFYLGRGGDHVKGGGGSDVFVFNETPWSGARIADFQHGQDRIDLHGLLAHAGYRSGDPVAEGFLKVTSGAGGANLYSNLGHVASGGGWWLVAHLDGVSASSLHVSDGWLI